MFLYKPSLKMLRSKERERERERERGRELTSLNKVACRCERVNSYPTEELVSDVRQGSVEVEARRPVGIAPKAITYNRCTIYHS